MELRRAPSLAFDRKDELQERFIRQVLGGGPGELHAHFVPSPTAYVQASLLGLGWGLNPEALVEPHLKARPPGRAVPAQVAGRAALLAAMGPGLAHAGRAGRGPARPGRNRLAACYFFPTLRLLM